MATKKTKYRGHAPTMSLALSIYACTSRAFRKIYRLHKIHVHNLQVLINMKYHLDLRNIKSMGMQKIYEANGVIRGKPREMIDFYVKALVNQGCLETRIYQGHNSYGITLKGENILKALDQEILNNIKSGEEYYLARPQYQYLDQFFKS